MASPERLKHSGQSTQQTPENRLEWMFFTSGAEALMAKNTGLYQSLLAEEEAQAGVRRSKIDKDVHRTFMVDPEQADRCPKCKRLSNILCAYSRYNPPIGYCQGLNYVAAYAMQASENAYAMDALEMDGYIAKSEEISFWLFTAMVHPLQGFWQSGTPDYLQAVTILQGLIESILPGLAEHLTQNDINLHIFASQWLHTIYTHPELPPVLTEAAWDLLLVEGLVALFTVSISMLNIVVASRLQKEDIPADELLPLLKNPPKESVQRRELLSGAASVKKTMNAETMKSIARLCRAWPHEDITWAGGEQGSNMGPSSLGSSMGSIKAEGRCEGRAKRITDDGNKASCKTDKCAIA